VEVDDRLAIEAHHVDLTLRPEAMDRSEGPEAGVVDEDLDVEAELADPRPHGVSLGRFSKVGAHDLGSDTVVARELVGQLAQALLAARGEDDAVPTRGELAGDRRPDSRRGAGDQGGGGL